MARFTRVRVYLDAHTLLAARKVEPEMRDPLVDQLVPGWSAYVLGMHNFIHISGCFKWADEVNHALPFAMPASAELGEYLAQH